MDQGTDREATRVEETRPRLLGLLPTGASLPAEQLARRHMGIVRFLWTCSFALVGLVAPPRPDRGAHLAEAVLPGALGTLAWVASRSVRLRATIASVGLMTVTVVAVHHVVNATTGAGEVFNHQAAVNAPLLWSSIHTALFAAMCATTIVHWNIHEHARLEQRTLAAHLRQLSLRDPLTDLANRRLLTDRLALAIRSQPRREKPVSLLMLDLDGFKPVNDMHGHAVVDELLVRLAARLSAVIRPGEVDAEELLARADVAMYAAKRAGRGQAAAWRPGMGEDEPLGDLPVEVVHARAWADFVLDIRAEVTVGQAMVQEWAAAMVEAGLITTTRSTAAGTFWRQLVTLVAPSRHAAVPLAVTPA